MSGTVVISVRSGVVAVQYAPSDVGVVVLDHEDESVHVHNVKDADEAENALFDACRVLAFGGLEDGGDNE